MVRLGLNNIPLIAVFFSSLALYVFLLLLFYFPADSLADSVDGSALHRFQVMRARAQRVTAVRYTL